MKNLSVIDCLHPRRSVTDSRPADGYIRRRCKCQDCGKRFTTVEVEVKSKRGMTLIQSLKEQYGKSVFSRDLNRAIELLDRLREGSEL